MNKFYLIFCLTGLFVLQGLSSWAQKKDVQYGAAGYDQYVGRGKDQYHRLVKDVWFEIPKDSARITGDSAIYYEKKGIMVVFGRVRIKQGDSTTITAKRLNYYSQDKLAELRDNVVFKNGKLTIFTDYMDYHTDTKNSRYYNGGKILDDQNTLTSEEAEIHDAENEVLFYQHVVLVSPQSTIKTDTLIYHKLTKIARSIGPTTTITNDGKTVKAKGGTFYTDIKQVSYAQGFIQTPSYRIYGDQLFFDDIRKLSIAKGHVKAISDENHVVLLGDKAESSKKTGITKVFGSPLVKKAINNDTLYIRSDTLIAHDPEDSTQQRIFAFHHVKIYRSDLQGLADSLVYNVYDSMLFFYTDPVLWSQENQMTADTITMLLSGNKIKRMDLMTNSFLVNIDTVANYNQIKGRQMKAYFQEDTLQRVDVFGNAETNYFFLDDKDNHLIGMNHSLSSSMRLFFEKNELDNISFYTKPEGEFIPPQELKNPQKRLAGFTWHGQEKPTLAEVLQKWADSTLVVPDTVEVTPQQKEEILKKPQKPKKGKENLQPVRLQDLKKEGDD